MGFLRRPSPHRRVEQLIRRGVGIHEASWALPAPAEVAPAELVEEIVTGDQVFSRELGLELVRSGDTLRLYNPPTREFLLTPAESYIRAEAEAAARQEAEQRAARLAAKLRELGLDPDQV